MITEETTPLYYEDAVAELLGLARTDLRYLRTEHLSEGEDWSKLEKKIVLSQAGIDRLVVTIRQSSNQLPQNLDFSDCRRSEKKKGAAADPDLVELQVVRLLRNPRLLTALDPRDSCEVRVRVKSNENFRPRMLLKARQVSEGLYQMEGRCPRFPGRY